MELATKMLGRIEVPGTGPVPGTKPRALLVTLLLQANRTVSVDRLMEALWEVEPPRSAVANLRTYAHALRRPLDRVGVCLESGPGGYVLRAVPPRCDHLCFADLVDRGQEALAAGCPADAVDLLERALDLWRGPCAAEGVPRHGPLGGWLGDLDEERLRAAESLGEAHIGAGCPRAAVRVLNALLVVAPLRGRAWRLRMLAHHRLGESAAVVDTYRSATRLFREELGVDSDPELTRLYRALLRWDAPSYAPGESERADDATSAARATREALLRRNLPRARYGLPGRAGSPTAGQAFSNR
jgi:DNA-binding SARP family transcriptional activator